MIKMLKSWQNLVKRQRAEVKEWQKDYKWELIMYYALLFLLGALIVICYRFNVFGKIADFFKGLGGKIKSAFKKDSEKEGKS